MSDDRKERNFLSGSSFPIPNLIGVFFPLGLGDTPEDEEEEEGSESSKDVEDATTTEGIIDNGEELSDEKSRDEVAGERPRLGGTDGFLADEFGGEHERDRSHSDGKEDDEEKSGDGGEDAHGEMEGDG